MMPPSLPTPDSSLSCTPRTIVILLDFTPLIKEIAPCGIKNNVSTNEPPLSVVITAIPHSALPPPTRQNNATRNPWPNPYWMIPARALENCTSQVQVSYVHSGFAMASLM